MTALVRVADFVRVNREKGTSGFQRFDYLRLVDLEALLDVAELADEGHDADAHEGHPLEDGRITECPLCFALTVLESV